MIKKLSNIKGVTIDTNGIIDGTSAVYHNEDTYEIKNGKTMLVKFSNFSLSSITKIGKAKMILPVYGYGTFELLVLQLESNNVTSKIIKHLFITNSFFIINSQEYNE